jgi:NAD(P)-dependent dehydrogenase (short-subunit alcohol dehydrogenase family)
MRLEGKIAIVTGGARGIGEGIARCLAEEGARVALLDLDGEQAVKTAEALGAGHIGLYADVAEESEAERSIAEVVRQLGGLDILVNNAGAGRQTFNPDEVAEMGLLQGLAAIDQPGWDEQLAQNLRTTFVMSKAATPQIVARGGGSIVNVASIAGQVAAPTLPAYAAAKAGVISLSRSMALDLGPKNVRVNAICPGFLWTRAWEGMATLMQRSNPSFANMTPREVFLQIVAQGVPLAREQTPEDIGRLAAFLASDHGKNITGQAIAVDGGITLR